MKISKTNRLAAHLANGNTITGKEAMNLWGLYRLSSSIYVLRNKGMNIKTTMIKSGEDTFARYSVERNEILKELTEQVDCIDFEVSE